MREHGLGEGEFEMTVLNAKDSGWPRKVKWSEQGDFDKRQRRVC